MYSYFLFLISFLQFASLFYLVVTWLILGAPLFIPMHLLLICFSQIMSCHTGRNCTSVSRCPWRDRCACTPPPSSRHRSAFYMHHTGNLLFSFYSQSYQNYDGMFDHQWYRACLSRFPHNPLRETVLRTITVRHLINQTFGS